MTELEKPPLELKNRVLSTRQKKNPKAAFGAFAEKQVAQFLINSKYKILGRNVRVGNSEADIVAFDPKFNEIVFVEVKAVKNNQFGWGSQAVNYRKIENLQKVASVFIKEFQMSKSYRFDIICFCKGEIEHFQNVTWNF